MHVAMAGALNTTETQRELRRWCVEGVGRYSVTESWLNSDEQRAEMLSYAVREPILVSGPPLSCTGA